MVLPQRGSQFLSALPPEYRRRLMATCDGAGAARTGTGGTVPAGPEDAHVTELTVMLAVTVNPQG